MSDAPDSAGKSKALDEPGFVDGIPVEELVRLTREFTSRIVNEDRQRLALELNESGHHHSLQINAPYLLQQFFIGKIDLDMELGKRYPSPPLLSSGSFTPSPGTLAAHGFAQFQSQDNAAAMSIELFGTTGGLDINFALSGMISIRFNIGAIANSQRRRFLELMRRENGITFLWTRERWERDYLIFIVREQFARIYAFGPGRHEGSCRLTPDGLNQLLTWLGALWPDDGEAHDLEPEASPSDGASW